MKYILTGIGLLIAICLSEVRDTRADIYMYVDERGVYHFSDHPKTKQYKLYMRTGRSFVRPTISHTYRNDYDALILKAARQYGVDFDLIKSMIKVESDFDPRAVSPKGALGLMQIMPYNVSTLNITDPFDPYQNIMGGARFFKQMLDRFNGDVTLALAAYNAGPGAVERNQMNVPGIPETRDYVNKVLKHYEYLARR